MCFHCLLKILETSGIRSCNKMLFLPPLLSHMSSKHCCQPATAHNDMTTSDGSFFAAAAAWEDLISDFDMWTSCKAEDHQQGLAWSSRDTIFGT